VRQKTAAQLVTGARELSDTVGDLFVSDQEVLDRCNEALSELYEWIVATYEHYRITSLLFSLTGGAAGGLGVAALALPDDFFKEVVVMRSPGTSSRFRVRRLPSLAEIARRDEICYELIDDELQIFPPERASGNYQLLYTPVAPEIAFPITVNFTIDAADHGSVPPPGGLAGIGAWVLANGTNGVTDTGTIPATGGFDLVLTFLAPNASFSGTYNVVSVGLPPGFGSPTFGCQLASTSGFTNPASGTGTYTFQPAGTVGELPILMMPWYEYIITGAAIRIKDKKEMPTDVLERRLTGLKARVEQIAANRASDPQQVPLTQHGQADWDSFP
jgi:hypothetical protein